jgi:predicted transcriptional regulator
MPREPSLRINKKWRANRCSVRRPARLSKIATQEGVDPEELVKDAALRLIEDDARFRAGVRKGLEQADRGQFIEEEEMDAGVKRMFQS